LPLLLSRVHQVYRPHKIRGNDDIGDEDVTAFQAIGDVVRLSVEHSEAMIAFPADPVKVHFLSVGVLAVPRIRY
jgi:hypothetical protein